MKNSQNKSLYCIIFIIVILSIITTSLGFFYSTGGTPYNVTNQYGNIVKIYGDGIYAHDSYFKALIFRGGDITVLFLMVPSLVVAMILDIKKNSLKRRMFLTSVISFFVYYFASAAFGATYNSLNLLYITLFSVSFFGLIIAITSLDPIEVEKSMKQTLPYKGCYAFLVLTGTALIVAWLPDIISALLANRSLASIEVYTTEITYVLDMGIVAPSSFICLYLLKKRNGMGYVLLGIVLTMCMMVGILLPIQTILQLTAGIEFTTVELITKIGSFGILALFALYLNIKFMKAVGSEFN